MVKHCWPRIWSARHIRTVEGECGGHPIGETHLSLVGSCEKTTKTWWKCKGHYMGKVKEIDEEQLSSLKPMVKTFL